MHAEGNVAIQTPTRPAEPLVARPRTTLLPRPVTATPARTWYNAVKRVFDIAMALTLLLLSLPIVLLAALMVKFTSRGPAFYSQTRVGRGGRPFTIWKLRSMVVDSEKHGAQWCKKGDPRVTTVGRFLRRSHIDELPQLWNILRGDMSLVGPRPERPHFVDEFSRRYPRYVARHRVPSGLTGLAQSRGLRGDTSISERARFDNIYIESWSLWGDTKIALHTVWQLLRRTGS